MGRIKTKLVKRNTNELVEKFRDNFSDKYKDNKAVIDKYADIPSKKLRNIITGYITRLIKNTKDI